MGVGLATHMVHGIFEVGESRREGLDNLVVSVGSKGVDKGTGVAVYTSGSGDVLKPGPLIKVVGKLPAPVGLPVSLLSLVEVNVRPKS